MGESSLRDRARRLRREETEQERVLWRHLRGSRFAGIKFRRQVVIGRFIVDFCSLERRLAIELDGSQHADNVVADAERTEELRSRGFRVMRFWNREIAESVDSVLERIGRAIEGEDDEDA